jgi:hypothetical protein
MKQASFRMSAAALAVALLAAPATGFGESGVPARNANVWDWRAHQPTEAQVEQKENAAGVAPAPSQRDSASDTVDQIYRQLMDGKRT